MSQSIDICCVVGTKVIEGKIHPARMYPKLVCKGCLEHNLQSNREIKDTPPISFCALGEHNNGSSGVLRFLHLLKRWIEVGVLPRECDTNGALE